MSDAFQAAVAQALAQIPHGADCGMRHLIPGGGFYYPCDCDHEQRIALNRIEIEVVP